MTHTEHRLHLKKVGGEGRACGFDDSILCVLLSHPHLRPDLLSPTRSTGAQPATPARHRQTPRSHPLPRSRHFPGQNHLEGTARLALPPWPPMPLAKNLPIFHSP